MSTIRVRSPASYWLAVPAAPWMLGVVVVPIVLLVWVSFWGGRTFSPASPLTFDNYARFFANQTYIKLAGTTVLHTVTLMAVTGVLGYCIAYFLVMKVKSPGWRLALFMAFIIPFWTSTLIRAIAWVPFLGVNGVINQLLMSIGATQSPIEAFLYSQHRHHHGPGVALHHDGRGPGRVHAELHRAAAARGGDDPEGARRSRCSGASPFR